MKCFYYFWNFDFRALGPGNCITLWNCNFNVCWGHFCFVLLRNEQDWYNFLVKGLFWPFKFHQEKQKSPDCGSREENGCRVCVYVCVFPNSTFSKIIKINIEYLKIWVLCTFLNLFASGNTSSKLNLCCKMNSDAAMDSQNLIFVKSAVLGW